MNKSKGLLAIILVVVIAYIGYDFFIGEDQNPEKAPNTQSKVTPQTQPQKSLNQKLPSSDELPQKSSILHEQLKEVRLLGLVASNEGNQASATIESGIHTQTYYLGEQIAYTTAILTKVMNDRVTLTIADEDYVILLVGSPASQGQSDQTAKSDPIREAELAIAREIGTRPKKLEHIVTLTNQANNGYQVLPGLNPNLFRSAGFKEGDVLEKVNGHELSDPAQFEQVVALIPKAETLIFTVLRGGRYVTLYLDIPSEELKISR